VLSVAGSGFSGGTWITLAGELDMRAVEVHGRGIRALVVPGDMVVVDATGIEFIDLSGARLLLELDVLVRSGGARMRLLASNPIRRLLELMDAHEFLAGEEDLEPGQWPDGLAEVPVQVVHEIDIKVFGVTPSGVLWRSPMPWTPRRALVTRTSPATRASARWPCASR